MKPEKGVRGNIVKELPINERIRAREVLLIGDGGQRLGVMPTRQALQMARDQGLDLVEVASQAAPPVCRILDYGKYKYEQEKKERQSRKSQRSGLLRELRVRPKINEHDLEAKGRLVTRLLGEGDKVRVSVFFRGREITHPDIGWKLLQKLSLSLKDVAVVEKPPAMEGNALAVTFAPNKKAVEARSVKERPTKELVKESDAKVKDSQGSPTPLSGHTQRQDPAHQGGQEPFSPPPG